MRLFNRNNFAGLAALALVCALLSAILVIITITIIITTIIIIIIIVMINSFSLHIVVIEHVYYVVNVPTERRIMSLKVIIETVSHFDCMPIQTSV